MVGVVVGVVVGLVVVARVVVAAAVVVMFGVEVVVVVVLVVLAASCQSATRKGGQAAHELPLGVHDRAEGAGGGAGGTTNGHRLHTRRGYARVGRRRSRKLRSCV